MSFEDEDFNLTILKFEQMLETNNVYFFDADDIIDIADYYIREENLAKAKKAVKIGLDQHPDNLDISLLRSEIIILEGKLNIAFAFLKKLMSVGGNSSEMYMQLAEIYSKKHQHKEAVEMLKKALALFFEDGDDEEIANIHGMLGTEYLFMEEYRIARNYLSESLRLDPKNYVALHHISFASKQLKDNDWLINFLEDYLSETTHNEIAWIELGMAYCEKDMYTRAVDCFDFAIISNPKFISSYMLKGGVLEKLFRYEEAIDVYNDVETLSSQKGLINLRKGYCYKFTEGFQVALPFLEKAIKHDPLLDEAWFLMFEYYLSENKPDKALQCLRKAINIDSANKAYLMEEVKLHLKMGRFQKAQQQAKRILKPGLDKENYVVSVYLMLSLGNVDQTISFLRDIEKEKSIENEPELAYCLATAYLYDNVSQKGLHFLSEALALDYDMAAYFQEEYPSVYGRPLVKDMIESMKPFS